MVIGQLCVVIESTVDARPRMLVMLFRVLAALSPAHVNEQVAGLGNAGKMRVCCCWILT